MGISFGGINGIADQSMSPPAGAGKGGASQPGIYSMPDQLAFMQPQQYTQVPYAQQYAQQGNINDPTVFAALQALNAPAFVSQPTQRYGNGIMQQPSGGGKGGVGQANTPMIQDWRTMRDQIVARTPVAPDPTRSSNSGGSSSGMGSDSMSGVGQGINNTAADAGLAMMAYPSLMPFGMAVNAAGYGIAGQQADAMGRAEDSLSSIQSADQLGVMSKSDVNGNVFSVVTPASITAADEAFFGLGPVSGIGYDYGGGGYVGSDSGGYGGYDSGGYGGYDSGSYGGSDSGGYGGYDSGGYGGYDSGGYGGYDSGGYGGSDSGSYGGSDSGSYGGSDSGSYESGGSYSGGW